MVDNCTPWENRCSEVIISRKGSFPWTSTSKSSGLLRSNALLVGRTGKIFRNLRWRAACLCHVPRADQTAIGFARPSRMNALGSKKPTMAAHSPGAPVEVEGDGEGADLPARRAPRNARRGCRRKRDQIAFVETLLAQITGETVDTAGGTSERSRAAAIDDGEFIGVRARCAAGLRRCSLDALRMCNGGPVRPLFPG